MFNELFTLAPWAGVLLLVAGFFPLVKGSDWLVDGAGTLARRLGVSPLVIGLTIVAFGTSMPELVVNIFSAAQGSSDLALGNVLGSNIFNILLILGLSALVYPLEVKNSTTWIEIPLTLLSALVLFVLSCDQLLGGLSLAAIPELAAKTSAHDYLGILNRQDGLILLGFFFVFLAYTISSALKGSETEALEEKDFSLKKSILLIGLGLIGLVLGAKLIVDGAVQLARQLGLSERIIGLTIVAIGTSLPELATSVAAARKKNTDIAVGNLVGSNIFNALFILGVSSLITGLPVSASSFPDLIINIFCTLLLLFFVFFPKGRKISRLEGGIFVLLYCAYTAYLLFFT